METTLERNILFHFIEKYIEGLEVKDINSRGKETKEILESMKNKINPEIDPRLFNNISRIESRLYGDMIISDKIINYINLGQIEIFNNILNFIKNSYFENKQKMNPELLNKLYNSFFNSIEMNILKETFLNKFGKKEEFEKAYEKIKLLKCEMIQ